MAITLTLTLCEGRGYEKRREALYRDVEWPSVPPEGMMLGFGLDEDGSDTGLTATISRVFYNASGSIRVEASLNGLASEYDNIVADARRDGFLDYGAWRQNREEA